MAPEALEKNPALQGIQIIVPRSLQKHAQILFRSRNLWHFIMKETVNFVAFKS